MSHGQRLLHQSPKHSLWHPMHWNVGMTHYRVIRCDEGTRDPQLTASPQYLSRGNVSLSSRATFAPSFAR